MARWVYIGIAIAAMALAACDRSPRRPTTAPVPSSAARYELDLEPLTPLEPNRPTHVAVDALGNLCWVQETPTRDDVVFAMGEGRIPRATELTSARLAEALGADKGAGNIQSLAAGRNGQVYFYFQGTAGKKLLAAVGAWWPQTGKVWILSDTDALMSATRMGPSLALARVTLLSTDASLWLWFRQMDSSALFRVPLREITEDGPLRLEERRVLVAMQGHEMPLTDDRYALSPGPDDTLFWLDRPEAMLNRIDRDGRVIAVRSLSGLPVSVSAPAVDASGRLLVFAGSSPVMEERNFERPRAERVRVNVKYPALLVLDKSDVLAIGREAINAHAGFSLDYLRLGELVGDPRRGAWVGYDPASGELLRVRIVAKD